VHKKYRRRGIAAALRYEVFRELKKRGIKRFYGGALKENTASLRLARAVGFHEFEIIQFIKVIEFKKWLSKRISDEYRA